MAENGVPTAVILSFAGHISLRMQQQYTQVSMMAKRKAVASTWSESAPAMKRIMADAAVPGDERVRVRAYFVASRLAAIAPST